MERSMGLEPTPGPWQGPVLPLYYDRPGTTKLYHDALAATRSYPIGVQRIVRRPQEETHPWRPQLRTAGNPVLCCLAGLKHARCLNDGRLPLPLSKLGSLGMVRVNTAKFLAVFVKNRNLPVFVLSPSVLPQLGAF